VRVRRARRVVDGFNLSSKHLDSGGSDGQAGRLDEGVDGQACHEIAREAVITAGHRAAIATGCTSEVAATSVRLSQAAGTRWFRDRGGMPTFMVATLKGRYLSFEEPEETALLHARAPV
jgi:hypothetical protein